MTKSKRVHKWAVEFNPKNLQVTPGSSVQLPCTDLSPPVGFIHDTKAVAAAIHSNKEAVDTESLLVKKSWDIALGPMKQIPMNLFIMWMAGNTISIFPIMMVGMMFFRPISALFNLKPVFVQIQGSMAPLQKCVYILGNVVCLGLAVYKCQVMGLLPTTASDWLAFEEPQRRMEFSGGGISL